MRQSGHLANVEQASPLINTVPETKPTQSGDNEATFSVQSTDGSPQLAPTFVDDTNNQN
jgi:hypothetical protein